MFQLHVSWSFTSIPQSIRYFCYSDGIWGPIKHFMCQRVFPSIVSSYSFTLLTSKKCMCYLLCLISILLSLGVYCTCVDELRTATDEQKYGLQHVLEIQIILPGWCRWLLHSFPATCFWSLSLCSMIGLDLRMMFKLRDFESGMKRLLLLQFIYNMEIPWIDQFHIPMTTTISFHGSLLFETVNFFSERTTVVTEGVKFTFKFIKVLRSSCISIVNVVLIMFTGRASSASFSIEPLVPHTFSIFPDPCATQYYSSCRTWPLPLVFTGLKSKLLARPAFFEWKASVFDLAVLITTFFD